MHSVLKSRLSPQIHYMPSKTQKTPNRSCTEKIVFGNLRIYPLELPKSFRRFFKIIKDVKATASKIRILNDVTSGIEGDVEELVGGLVEGAGESEIETVEGDGEELSGVLDEGAPKFGIEMGFING